MRRALSCLAILLFATAVARATVLLPAEFREVVNGSEIIAYGRVSDVRAEWAPGRRGIDTIVTFEVATYLKGGPSETLTFRVPGGQIGRYKNVLIGAPEFTPGDEAVLFLRANGPAISTVFGLNQGVYRVRTDAQSGRRVVVMPPVIARGEADERVTRGSVSRKSLDLDAFAEQVRVVLGGAR